MTSASGAASCSCADRLRAAASKALSSRPGRAHSSSARGLGTAGGVVVVVVVVGVGVVVGVVVVVGGVAGVGVAVGVGGLPASTSTRCPTDHHCAWLGLG